GGPQVGHVVADAHAVAGRHLQVQVNLRQGALRGPRRVVRLEEGGEDLAVEIDVAVEEGAVDGDAAGQLRSSLGRHAQGEPAAQQGGEAVVEAVAHTGEGGFEPDRLTRRAASRQLDRTAVQEQLALLDPPAALAQGDGDLWILDPRRVRRGPEEGGAGAARAEISPQVVQGTGRVGREGQGSGGDAALEEGVQERGFQGAAGIEGDVADNGLGIVREWVPGTVEVRPAAQVEAGVFDAGAARHQVDGMDLQGPILQAGGDRPSRGGAAVGALDAQTVEPDLAAAGRGAGGLEDELGPQARADLLGARLQAERREEPLRIEVRGLDGQSDRAGRQLQGKTV